MPYFRMHISHPSRFNLFCNAVMADRNYSSSYQYHGCSRMFHLQVIDLEVVGYSPLNEDDEREIDLLVDHGYSCSQARQLPQEL